MPDHVGARDRLSVAFRIILLIPQFIAVALIGVAWAITTIIACYFLLLHDDYPPFSLS